MKKQPIQSQAIKYNLDYNFHGNSQTLSSQVQLNPIARNKLHGQTQILTDSPVDTFRHDLVS